MMRSVAVRLGLMLGGVAFAASVAHSQETMTPPPFQSPSLYSTKEDAGTLSPLSTREKAPPRPPSMQRTPPAMPATIPFGRASPEALVPAPTGPRSTPAAPVSDVGVSTGELAPAAPSIVQSDLLPPKDPEEPTPMTTPIFETQDAMGEGVRVVRLRGLNKVSARVETIEGPVGTVMRFGNLEVIAVSCRASAKKSRPDYAALLDIKELKADEEPKTLFMGWMYASSPSLVALEHPVYDVTVLGCELEKEETEKTAAAPKAKAAAKPKAKAR
jgi:hypothetical protein